MAQKTMTIDDYSGEPLQGPVEPTVLVYEGREYSLDLGPQSRQKLDAVLGPFLEVAEVSPVRDRVSPEEIRSWARGEGMAIKDQGRLSSAVIEAFNRAHGRPE